MAGDWADRKVSDTHDLHWRDNHLKKAVAQAMREVRQTALEEAALWHEKKAMEYRNNDDLDLEDRVLAYRLANLHDRHARQMRDMKDAAPTGDTEAQG